MIELVVVLGIIGVLAATIAPSFAGIRTNVRQAATLADLGSDRTALVGYATDNSGLAPSATGFDPRASALNLVGYGWTKERLRAQFHREVALASGVRYAVMVVKCSSSFGPRSRSWRRWRAGGLRVAPRTRLA